MISEHNAINVINQHLLLNQDQPIFRYYPVKLSQLNDSYQLCEALMDFLGDIYVTTCIGVNYKESLNGAEIYETIEFLAIKIGEQDEES